MATIYLAGGLFNAGERLHNVFLAAQLRIKGHKVILPQEEARKFFADGKFNLAGVVEECKRFCQDPTVIYVGCLDGSDADSGTAVEYGIAITSTKRAIVYRTDFRTALEKEVGVNGMFTLQGTTFIYHPCFFTDLAHIADYYKELAHKIHEAILKLL